MREGSVWRTAVGEQSEEEVASGCQPCGTSLLCHTFLGVQGTRGSKKRPLKMRKSCALLEQPLKSYRLGRRISQHGSPLWPLPEAIRSLQQCVKCLSRGQNSSRKYCQWIELAWFDGLYWPKPSVSSGKIFSCSMYCCCLWVCLSPCSEAAIFHTDGQYRELLDSVSDAKFRCQEALLAQ